MIEQKFSRGRLSAAFGPDGFNKRMWERFTVKKMWADSLLQEATKAVLLETRSSWQPESPRIEEVDLLRVNSDMRLDGTLIRQAIEAGTVGDW